MRASLLLCSCLAVLAALVAADGADYSVDYSSRSLLGASGCDCGCLVRNPFSGGCAQCKPCAIAQTTVSRKDPVKCVPTPPPTPTPSVYRFAPGRHLRGASGCDCGCLVRNPFSGGCSQCKPCALAQATASRKDPVNCEPTPTPSVYRVAPGRRLLAASGCDCGCQVRNPLGRGCSVCKPCVLAGAQDAAAKAVTTLQKTVDKFGTDLNRVGAVVDEARAAYTDPSGYIRNAIIRSNPAVMITQALARVRRRVLRGGPPRGLRCLMHAHHTLQCGTPSKATETVAHALCMRPHARPTRSWM
jgi:hypothetical protein